MTVLLALLFAAEAHIPVIELVGPDDDWCQVLNSSAYSDTFQFMPGEYVGPCDIVGPVPDNVGERLVIESFYPSSPAVFRTDGVADYILGISGTAVSVRVVEITGVPAGSSAIEFAGEDHIFEEIVAYGLEGGLLAQVGDAVDIDVLANDLSHAGGASIRLGCAGCSLREARVIHNLILGADVAVEAVGDPVAEVRDNFVGQGGIGILWTGSAADVSVVEENLVAGATEGLRLVGGRVVVRNNIVVASTTMVSVGPADHGIYGNTLYAADEAIRLEGWSTTTGFAFRNNALTGSLPVAHEGVVDGNVRCDEDCQCWMDAPAWDFYPAPDSPLRTGGVAQPFGELVADWCDNPRPSVPTAGALQAVGVLGPGPVELIGRSATSCSTPPDPPPGQEPDPCYPDGTGTGTGAATGTGTGTGAATDTSTEPLSRRRAESAGCGCATRGPAWSGPAWLAGCLVVLRRRRE